jgi:hypothetical protein
MQQAVAGQDFGGAAFDSPRGLSGGAAALHLAEEAGLLVGFSPDFQL